MYESTDGRNFNPRQSIDPPFYLKFTIIDEGEYYRAYGLSSEMVRGEKLNQDFRYPVLATSIDALNWQKADKQLTGPWTGNKIQVGAGAGIKLATGEYFFY